MRYMNQCRWCKKDFSYSFPTSQEFEARSVQLSCSDYDGCAGWGWQIEALCIPCTEKLGVELKKLGIELTEIDF